MERLSHELGVNPNTTETQMSDVANEHAAALQASADSSLRLAMPERLFTLDCMDVLYDQDHVALWTFMNPVGRASFTRDLLTDIETVQSLVPAHFGPGKVPLEFLVCGSRDTHAFSYGGDLDLFARLIRERDLDGLIAYGNSCVEVSYRNMRALDLPIVSIGLAQGEARGGGFEALLSFDYIIAEEGVKFSFPEIKFGLFPGMGAHVILSRKLGTAMADQMIRSGAEWSAEQLCEMGIVHKVAKRGEGVEEVRKFMARTSKHLGGIVGARRAMQVSAPFAMEEFYQIVAIWAESALGLREADLRMMTRLAGRQEHLAKTA